MVDPRINTEMPTRAWLASPKFTVGLGVGDHQLAWPLSFDVHPQLAVTVEQLGVSVPETLSGLRRRRWAPILWILVSQNLVSKAPGK